MDHDWQSNLQDFAVFLFVTWIFQVHELIISEKWLFEMINSLFWLSLEIYNWYSSGHIKSILVFFFLDVIIKNPSSSKSSSTFFFLFTGRFCGEKARGRYPWLSGVSQGKGGGSLQRAGKSDMTILCIRATI